MTRLLPLSFLCLVVACSTGGDVPDPKPAPTPAVAPDPFDDSDCNLETVLDPNKPGAPGNLIASARNPNGDSELAILMRLFVDNLRDAKVLIEAGEPVPAMFATHRTMRCAWPTNPAERNAGYDGRAQGYLAAVRAFDAAPAKDTYNLVVNSCIACHQINCGGVVPLLDSLRWE